MITDKTVCYGRHTDPQAAAGLPVCCKPCPDCGANIKFGRQTEHSRSGHCTPKNPIQATRLAATNTTTNSS